MDKCLTCLNIAAAMVMGEAAELDVETSASRFRPAGNGSNTSIRRWKTTELFAGARELIIEHASNEYRLRITSAGKLILTK